MYFECNMGEGAQKIEPATLLPELKFTFSRAGGPGGQHANKVSTRVQLRWDLAASQLLDEDQRSLLMKKLAPYLTADGVLLLASDKYRSQALNRDEVIQRFQDLLNKAFTFTRPRRPTSPTVASRKKRLVQKKQHAEKKQWRKKLKPGRE
jgi:ribosome-associated protein